MNHLARSLLSGAMLVTPLFISGCVYETYPHRYSHHTSYSYYDDDDRRERGYRTSAVWVQGHWYRGIWVRGHWE